MRVGLDLIWCHLAMIFRSCPSIGSSSRLVDLFSDSLLLQSTLLNFNERH